MTVGTAKERSEIPATKSNEYERMIVELNTTAVPPSGRTHWVPTNPDDSTITLSLMDDSIGVSVAGRTHAAGYPHWLHRHLLGKVGGQSHHVGELKLLYTELR